MPEKSEKTEKDKKRGRFQLSELAGLAGVTGKTIHFYIRAGILPPARKVREKLALYDENHLGLLRLAQRLQKEKKLPLAFIAQLFRQGGYDAKALELGLVADMFEKASKGEGFLPAAQAERRKEERPMEGVSGELQKKLAALGLIAAAEGPMTGEEQKIAWIVSSAQVRGVSPEFFADLLTPVREIVGRETKQLLRTLDDRGTFRDVVKGLGETDTLVGRFLEAARARELRLHFERSFEESPLAIRKLREKVYVPSAAFLEKHEIPIQIEALDYRLAQDKKNRDLRLLLAEAYLATGRYEEMAQEAGKILARAKDDPDALIARAAADAFLGRTDEAVDDAQRAYERRPDDPRLAAYAAIAYITQAARVGGIVSPAQWVKKALALFEKSLSLTPKRLKDRIEILLMKGRAYTILPVALGQVDEGIEALDEVLEIVGKHREKELGLAFNGFNEIYRVNVYFYLGEAYQLKKDTAKASEAFGEVLLRDPASNFGRYAFERVSPRA